MAALYGVAGAGLLRIFPMEGALAPLEASRQCACWGAGAADTWCKAGEGGPSGAG